MCRTVPLFTTLVVALASCGPPPAAPPFPTDYEASWQEARTPCTLSHDHELRYIRVFTNAAAFEPYTQAMSAYPVGSILMKVEYDDPECSEPISFVSMEKLDPGMAAPEELGWSWRRFDSDLREVHDADAIPSTCIDCHRWHCAEPPYGWDYTCPPGAEEPSVR
jgi:hypothetical protein